MQKFDVMQYSVSELLRSSSLASIVGRSGETQIISVQVRIQVKFLTPIT